MKFCLDRRGKAGIVYCRRRAECDEVAAHLREASGGLIEADSFHAGRRAGDQQAAAPPVAAAAPAALLHSSIRRRSACARS